MCCDAQSSMNCTDVMFRRLRVDRRFLLTVVQCWGAVGPCSRVRMEMPDIDSCTTLRRAGSDVARDLSAVLKSGKAGDTRWFSLYCLDV